MRHNGVVFLEQLLQLVSDDSFALAILAIVGVAVVLAFMFGATIEIVVTVLIVGVTSAIAENKLRAKN
jgi:hypothetical protein